MGKPIANGQWPMGGEIPGVYISKNGLDPMWEVKPREPISKYRSINTTNIQRETMTEHKAQTQ